MSSMSDARFTEVDIPGSPSGGAIFQDSDPFGKTAQRIPLFDGGRWVRLSIDVAVIAPELFRHYLDLVITHWGEPSFYCGYAGIQVWWENPDGDVLRRLELTGRGDLSLMICSAESDADGRWYEWNIKMSTWSSSPRVTGT
ncbi:hypothetical protein [Nocardia sp. NPDC004722]